MLGLLLALAGADPVDLSDFDEVRPVAEARGGVLDRDAVWVATEGGCLEGRIEGGQTPRLDLPRCERTTEDEVQVRCVQSQGLGLEWWAGGGLVCSWELPDGTGGGWGGSWGQSHHGRPVLVELTEERAVWRTTVRLGAEPEQRVVERRPCDARSLRRLKRAAPEGGERRCDASTGLRHYVVPVGYGRLVGEGQRVIPEPVDCREPCPENAELERVRAEVARLEGLLFAPRDGLRVGLYAQREACEEAATAGGGLLELVDAECAPDPAPWEEPDPRD